MEITDIEQSSLVLPSGDVEFLRQIVTNAPTAIFIVNLARNLVLQGGEG